MSIYIKPNSITSALLNYDSIKEKQKSLLTESFIQKCKYKKINGTLTETAVISKRTRDLICISTKPSVVLYETSLYNLETQDTIKTLNKVMQICDIDPQQIYPYIIDENQKVADFIMFYLPGTLPDNILNSKFKEIDKIMTAYGYFLSITPEKTKDDNGNIEYTIQYEPNFPDYRKLWLPQKLHHVTTIENSNNIKKHGFVLGTNDIYKYNPRIYFIEYVSAPLLIHIIRRYKKEQLYNKKTNKLQYADITINTPTDIKFYFDHHMKDINSYFTFDPIDKKYIDNIDIKPIPPMAWLLEK